jgi:hypothetical protein
MLDAQDALHKSIDEKCGALNATEKPNVRRSPFEGLAEYTDLILAVVSVIVFGAFATAILFWHRL